MEITERDDVGTGLHAPKVDGTRRRSLRERAGSWWSSRTILPRATRLTARSKHSEGVDGGVRQAPCGEAFPNVGEAVTPEK
jgi:hypothetical protein